MCSGEVHDAVRVERVAAAREVEAEVQALGGGDVGHALLHRKRLVAAHAVLLGEMRRAVVLALARSGRVELERAPRHLHLVAVLEAGERGLEAALADVAPGTGDVRPDLDVHRSIVANRCRRPEQLKYGATLHQSSGSRCASAVGSPVRGTGAGHDRASWPTHRTKELKMRARKLVDPARRRRSAARAAPPRRRVPTRRARRSPLRLRQRPDVHGHRPGGRQRGPQQQRLHPAHSTRRHTMLVPVSFGEFTGTVTDSRATSSSSSPSRRQQQGPGPARRQEHDQLHVLVQRRRSSTRRAARPSSFKAAEPSRAS